MDDHGSIGHVRGDSTQRATRISAIERLLFLRADDRNIIERIRAMLRVAATDMWFCDILLRVAIDVSEDDWLHVFVAGGYAPTIEAADLFIVELSGGGVGE